MDKKGSKFNYDSYAVKNDQSKPFTETLNLHNCKRICICSNYNENKCFQCFKCKQKIHNCTKVLINRPQIHSFQCMSCLARSMDLIFQPQNILLETFFKTQNIFEKSNIINFQFTLKYEQTKFPVDVRCFKGSKIELVWPMQGQFYLNRSNSPAFTLKPLKSNSNRKNRKQDTFLIQPGQLKEGLNTLTFKIPRLQKNKFIESFQYEQTGTYYLALYSVKELTNQQVLNITQRQRRHEKASTLALFHLGDEQLPTQKQKIRLIDPYTCERIKFPVRGRYCKHVSTICLLTYISFQKRSRSWKCPICAVQVGSFLNQPYLDVWIYEMLKEKDKGDSVIIYANGMYEWEDTAKSVIGLDDSDDSNQDLKKIQDVEMQKILQQPPLALALQNIDLESHPQQVLQTIPQQQVDLCEYEYVIQYNENDPLHQTLMYKNSLRNQSQIIQTERFEEERNEVQSQGQMSDGLYDMAMLNNNAHIDLMQDYALFNQKLPEVSDVIIDDQHIQQESRMSSSNSQLQHLAVENQFIPPSIISNIVPSEQPRVLQKPQTKVPQIYTAPLQQKNNRKKQELNQVMSKLIKQKDLKNQTKIISQIQPLKKQSIKKIPVPNKNLQQNHSKIIPIVPNKNKKIDDNKRLLQRPSYIDSKQTQQKVKSLSLPNQKYQPISIGKVNRKNIELSQAKSSKIQPKTQYKPHLIFPPPKPLKKQETQISKSKQIKIKTLNFEDISHLRFVKTYCNIPIPPLMRKMNDDMKRLFKNILEIN